MTAYLLYNGQRVNLYSELKLLNGGVAKACFNRAFSYIN